MARTLLVKVRDRRESNEGSQYKNEVDIHNPELIAIVLMDLMDMFGAPIEKACSIILNRKKTFPF